MTAIILLVTDPSKIILGKIMKGACIADDLAVKLRTVCSLLSRSAVVHAKENKSAKASQGGATVAKRLARKAMA